MWRRMRQGRGQGGMVGVRSEAILHRMVRDGHPQKVTFQQRPEGREGVMQKSRGKASRRREQPVKRP